MTPRRFFNGSERVALFLAADGKCSRCGDLLEPGWHADHVSAFSRGGVTDVTNGQALCPACNLKKGSTLTTLRTWQQEALQVIRTGTKQDYLISATPAAGKTFFGLKLFTYLLESNAVQRLVVVVPTDYLRGKWADDAAHLGLHLMPAMAPEDYDKQGYQGCVVTYAQLATGAGRDLLRRATRVPTLAILDEIHHAGKTLSWGDGLSHAVGLATTRVGLTGTPWRRNPRQPIPFVEYDVDGALQVDKAYEYGEAVADGVCRRVDFHAYDGEAKWIDHGVVGQAKLGGDLRDDDVSAVLDGVYRPDLSWMPVMVSTAWEALTEIRQEVPDAAALVIADTQWHALEYAKVWESVTGVKPVVVISDDVNAKNLIEKFRGSTDPALIAVKMVSEGVDIPRLAVGLYASKILTPLYFRQVVGRLVRTRPGETFNARMFIPAVPALIKHARDIEAELRHQLDIEIAKDVGEGGGSGPGTSTRVPISATEAEFHRAILAGQEFSQQDVTAAQGMAVKLGIPAQFALNLMPLLRQTTITEPTHPAPAEVVKPRHRQERMLRSEVEAAARKFAYRSGQEPREVNTALLREGFPARGKATLEQLGAMLDTLARWHGEL